MKRTYGQRETDHYTGYGRVGSGTAVHSIVDGRPVCGSGYSPLGISHKRHPRIEPTSGPATCSKCQAGEVRR